MLVTELLKIDHLYNTIFPIVYSKIFNHLKDAIKYIEEDCGERIKLKGFKHNNIIYLYCIYDNIGYYLSLKRIQ